MDAHELHEGADPVWLEALEHGPARALAGPDGLIGPEGPSSAGRRTLVAVRAGQVEAGVAALPFTVWIDAREACFALMLPDLVRPSAGAGELRATVARAFLERFGGRDRDVVHFVWPAPGDADFYRRTLGFDVVRTQTVLAREVEPGAGTLPAGVETLARFDHQARWLWDRANGSFGASAIRDEGFLNRRLRGAVGARYRVLCVRDGEGVLRGYAAWTRAPWLEKDRLTVVDWLVPANEPEAGDVLLAALRAAAQGEGARAIDLVLPDWSPWFVRFQRAGFRVLPSDLLLLAKEHDRRFDDIWLREHWWYTLADGALV
jgi:hypothetical protein